MNILKFLSPAYRRRRGHLLRFRQIKPRRRKFFRNPLAAYLMVHEGMHLSQRPGTNFRLTNIQAPIDTY